MVIQRGFGCAGTGDGDNALKLLCQVMCTTGSTTDHQQGKNNPTFAPVLLFLLSVT